MTSATTTLHVRTDTPISSTLFDTTDDLDAFIKVQVGDDPADIRLLVRDPAKLDELADVCREAASKLYAVQAEQLVGGAA
jgi:hypothetical protein